MEIDFVEEMTKINDPSQNAPLAPRDLNVMKDAKQDLADLIWRLKRTCKRKATTDWCLPEELWLLSLCPDYVSVRESTGEGLGYHGKAEEQQQETPGPILFVKAESAAACETENLAYEMILEVLIHCHRAKLAPALAHVSTGFFLSKPNGKSGMKGIRLIHLFAAFWRNYFAAVLQRYAWLYKFVWPTWAQTY